LSWTGSCAGANGTLSDSYAFTTTASGMVAAVMVSGDVDSLLFLTDSKGNPLRSDNNSYSQGNAIIVNYLAAGTYKLQATSDGFQNRGNYQVDVLFTAASSDPKTCAAKSATLGKSVTGTLSFTSCQYLDDTFADIYQVTVTDSSNPIDIALTSSAFDTYLILLDSKGNVMGIDDNSGGGTNAHLIQNVAVGTYFVVVKPASDPSSSGTYVMSVR
jgi:Bacterial pre-peptidase C-terminal domain